MVPRLQGPHLVRDAEELAEEILEMRCEIDQEVRVGIAVNRVGIAAGRHQPVVQRRVAFCEMRNKRPIEAQQALTLVKIGERKPVL